MDLESEASITHNQDQEEEDSSLKLEANTNIEDKKDLDVVEIDGEKKEEQAIVTSEKEENQE